ncbi:MAG: RNA-binding domain-containing protein, partial [Bacteroidota bacterium]
MTQKELQLILQEGEGYRIEFKESPNSIDKELVAFANASGGRVFLGITDDGRLKSIAIDNKLRSQVQDIANNCQPPIGIGTEEFKNIFIVNVKEGDDKPYKCSSGFYLRVGPNSQKLNRDEIVAFIKAEGKVRFDELVCRKFDFKKHFDRGKL